MCGRIAITLPVEAMTKLFDFPERPNWRARYNIGPTQDVPILRHVDGHTSLGDASWGFTALGRSAPLINARAETALERPTWAGAVRDRPCLFLASGYFEWDASRGRKQPWYIQNQDESPLLIAGCWRLQEGVCHAALLTRSPRQEIAHLHDRMPLLLSPAAAQTWINPGAPDRLDLLNSMIATPLKYHRVDPRVGKISHDEPSNVATYEPPCDPQMSLL